METLLENETVTVPNTTLLHEETFLAFQEQSLAPQWFKDLRAQAFAKFSALDRPSRKDEKWRYSGQISGFRPEGLPMPEAVVDSLPTTEALLEKPAAEFLFTDNKLQSIQNTDTKGITLLPLSTAIVEQEELIRPYLEKEFSELGSEKFTALHFAYLQEGVFLHAEKNVELADPIVVQYLHSHSGTLQNPFTLIVAEPNSRVDLVDMFSSAHEETEGYWIARQALYAKTGAKIFHKTIQNISESATINTASVAEAERDANIKQISVNLGAKKARSENLVRIQETGADIKLYSLTIAHGNQEFDQRTLQEHIGAHATSDLLYKNVLLDQSRTIFSGLIDVKKDAQQTDAFQTNRNLLISKEAEAIAMPGLEIEANDVRCSHGATTGQIDESEIFYFLSRGIPLAKARELLIFGFFEEIIEKIQSEDLQEALRKLVQEKFQTINHH